ncbi:MAG: rubrerythrin family protein [Bryobacteraceae bacterium]
MFNSRHGGAAQCAATLANLQAALNGEWNAKARYIQFAVQADAEGFGPVASLFRAAALAEGIHADNHKQVIAKMGQTPFVKFEIPEVNSTRENLEAAIRGESHERDEMYPAFIAQARADAHAAAERTFALALAAEAEHARLYTAALDNLENMRCAARTYFVCQVCGYTSERPEFDLCPACSASVEEFQEIS